MSNILILGGTGMLGSAVTKSFSDWSGKVFVSSRAEQPAFLESQQSWLKFDAAKDHDLRALDGVPKIDFVVNCIGVIKPYILDSDASKRANAIQVNTLFPQSLESWASRNGARVIQIATDCVFSGRRGMYLESDPHDATDVYGKTKSLGEVPSASMMHLRASIIGPEVGRSTSLLEWVRKQPKGAKIPGYNNHFWNGVTATHFASVTKVIISSNFFKAGVQHLVPADELSKYELVSAIAQHFGREDLEIESVESGSPVNRTLDTEFQDINLLLWKEAGYATPPSISQMISELPR